MTPGSKNESDRRIRAMGIVVLPYLVELIIAGSDDLVPWVAEITGGAVAKNATPEELVKWWDANRAKWATE